MMTIKQMSVVSGVSARALRYYEEIGLFSPTEKYSLQGTTQGRYLTGGVPPVRFSM